MAENDLHRRRKRFFTLSSQIAQIDQAQLQALMDDTGPSTSWGRNTTVDIGPSKVFVKRVPVTHIEYANMFSTANLYDLPTFYNYGVGSAGLGVFRELVTHIKTTNWVLDGAIATFPVLYHYRIIPFSGERAAVDMERHNGYVAYWDNNANIGQYVLDRAHADHELVLFLEYIPHMLNPWLLQNLHELPGALDDVRATITFLRKQGIIHFDAHFDNILTDGERPYVTDFGLALDKSFSLTADEAAFFERNTDYDYGEVLWSLGWLLHGVYDALAENDKRAVNEKYGIRDGIQRFELVTLLLGQFEELLADGSFKVDAAYVDSIVKYRSIIALMHDFYGDLYRNKKQDTNLQHVKLRRLLKEMGFLPGTGFSC